MAKIKAGPKPLMYPMPTVLVGANVAGKPNYQVVAWVGCMAMQPPAIAIGINKERYTLKGIEEQGTFSVNVASADMVKKVDYCGIYSGKNTDKSGLFKTFYGALKTAPLIEECPINLECRVVHKLELGSHMMFVGEIVETHLSDSIMTDGNPDPKKINPLSYSIATNQYQNMGQDVGPAFQIGKEI